jgi:hypothetical protein
MSTTQPEGKVPISLKDYLDLYNDKKIDVNELLKNTIPLLQQGHEERILQLAAFLLANNPAYYHLSGSHHAERLKDAEIACKPHLYADLALQPGELTRLADACRRAETSLNKTQRPTE